MCPTVGTGEQENAAFALPLLLGTPMTDPLYGGKPEDGFHKLKDVWNQKKYLGLQSDALRDGLKTAIHATFTEAPVRRQGFKLDRSPTESIDVGAQERRLEAAMMARWSRPGMWPVPEAWERLVAFQVPLFAEQVMQGWGYIDLLGVNSVGLPVVVELKKAPEATADGKTKGTETPLRMVLEAAAYAVALRKNWELFRREWIARLNMLDVPSRIIDQVPETLELVPLVSAAPASFWIDWLPVTEKGLTVSRETWLSFKSLLEALESENLPVSFVSISGHDQRVDGLAVQPLRFPVIV